MSPPNKPITLTPEIVEAFRAYYIQHPSWGIFHVALDDGNWWYYPDPNEQDWGWREPWTEEEHRLASMFRLMSKSQRSKLAGKV